MAISVQVGTEVENAAAATSIAVPYPATVTAGDWLVCTVVTGGSAATGIKTGTGGLVGWTQVAQFGSAVSTQSPSVGVFIKKAVGGETGTLAVTTDSILSSGQMLGFTGVDATTPQDFTAVTVDQTTAQNHVDLSATVATAGAALVAVASVNNTTGTTSPPTGFTETADRLNTGRRAWHMSYDLGVGSGATGTLSVGINTSVRSIAVLLGLRPAPVAYAVTGEVDAVSGTAGTVAALLAATALVAGTSGATAAVTGLYPTTGTVAGTLGASLTVGRSQAATGTVAGTSGTSASVNALHPVTGTVAATSGVSLDAPARHPVTGTVAAVSNATLVANLPGVAGTVFAVSGSSLSVNALHPVTGTVAGVSSAVLAPTARLVAGGTTAATSGVAADITGRCAVGGTVVVVSGVSANASIYIAPRNVTTAVTGHQRTITAIEHDRVLTAREHGATITATDRS
jgi:hypothetical protein